MSGAGLPERLARQAVIRAFPDHDLGDADLLPVNFSSMYQPVHDAVRLALDEAARLAREWDEPLDPPNGAAKGIAAAIEELK